jgi:chromosome segregation ATPase
MADDLLTTLTRFHREVMLPEVKDVVTEAVQQSERSLRDGMLSLFDGVFQRFDRLEAEYHSLAAAVARIERRLGSPDSDVERATIQEQLRELRRKAATLQRRIDELESTS